MLANLEQAHGAAALVAVFNRALPVRKGREPAFAQEGDGGFLCGSAAKAFAQTGGILRVSENGFSGAETDPLRL